VQGLAYVRLVRLREPWPRETEWPVLPDLGPLHQRDETLYRASASKRVLLLWSTYLGTASALEDAGISTIRNVVNVLQQAMTHSDTHE
jgi:hypothetical protein